MTDNLAKSMEPHEVTLIVRGCENIYICDRCGKEVKEADVMKSSGGKNRNYAYCPECAKILYPNYRRVAKVAFTNPIMKNIIHEACARYEKLR